MVQSVLAASPKAGHGRSAAARCSGRRRARPLPAPGTRLARQAQLGTASLPVKLCFHQISRALEGKTRRRKHFSYRGRSRCCFQPHNALDDISNENFLISVAA